MRRRAGLWKLLAAGLTVPDQKSESHHNTGESRCHAAECVVFTGRSGGNAMRARAIRGPSCLAILLLMATIGLGAFGVGAPPPAAAQAVPKSLEEGGSDDALKARKNAWTVGVAGGLMSGTNMTFADEMAQILDDGDNLRVIPMVTHGAASNLEDLLYLHGVDVAITQSDVLEYFRSQRKIVNLESRVHYILRLPISEMHVLAGTDIKSIEDLRGKKVNFGPAGSASSLTGSIVFQRYGVKVEPTLYDNAVALQKLQAGEIAALIRVSGKPVDFFARIPAGAGLHFVPLAFSRTFADFYTLGELTSQEYPGLVPAGQTVDTIAVPSVLAVLNWPKNAERYRRVQRFVEALYTKWDQFLLSPRHPKWKEVNLAATLPGWTRWSAADDMLHKIRQDTVADTATASGEFAAFLKTRSVAADTPEQREALFREFLQWQQRQHPRQGQR
jgi:TRAP-type uncharacterized transport system substrate-binding protein